MTLAVKKSLANVGDPRDPGLIPGLGRAHRVGAGNPLQHSCLENPMDSRAWQATVCGIAKGQTLLNTYAPTHIEGTSLDLVRGGGFHVIET